jgi:hypothetical protein
MFRNDIFKIYHHSGLQLKIKKWNPKSHSTTPRYDIQQS